MANLQPYLRFNDGKCREALEFYKKCLGGGEINFMTVKDSPMHGDIGEDRQDYIMHSTFKKGDIQFIGMDMMRDVAKVGDNWGMSLECDSEEELNTFFNNLKEGGEVFMEPEKQFWGGIFGVLTDKYGIEWMFNYQVENN